MFKKIFFLLDKNEIKFLIIISIFLLLGIFFEMLSFVIIIPVFNLVFLNDFSDNFLLNLFFTDNYTLENNNSKVIILVIMLSIFFIKNIYLIIFNYFNKKFFYDLNIRLSTNLFTLYLKQNYFFFLKNKSDNLLRKSTNDIIGFQTFLSSFQALIAELILLFFLAILLLSVNYIIFLFCTLVFISIMIIYIKIVKKRIRTWSYDYQKNLGSLQNLVVEGVSGVRDVIIYNLEKFFSRRFSYFVNSTQVPFFKIDFINNVQRFWMEILAVVSMTVPMIYFIYFEVDINELLPTFVLFCVSVFRIVPSFNRIILNYQNIKFFMPSVNLIYNEFVDLEIKEIDIKDDNFKFNEKIELKNIGFSYGSNQVLSGINIKIKKGSSIAITGSNGSGKSTLLNVVSGLVEPTEGKIIVDDKYNVYKNLKSWQNNISFVQQNIFLINTSIKKNIILEDSENIDNTKFNRISNLLSLDEMFENLPNKLDTLVGTDGQFLSGGQKQLISIARALYKENEIIIFDEASSALDKKYMKILQNLLISLRGSKTIIVITHQFNDIKKIFDNIYEIQSTKLLSK